MRSLLSKQQHSLIEGTLGTPSIEERYNYSINIDDPTIITCVSDIIARTFNNPLHVPHDNATIIEVDYTNCIITLRNISREQLELLESTLYSIADIIDLISETKEQSWQTPQ